MAEDRRMTAGQVVEKVMTSEHVDVVRESIAWLVGELMEAEVGAQIGAELGEVSPERVTHRNGYRPRPWQTRAGEIELAIPKLRQGSYFPSFLEPRKRSEQALVAVVQEAYVNGVSTRKVDRLVEQLGIAGIGKDAVSRLCRGLDEQMRIFRERPLEGRYPYVWLDGKIEKVREHGAVRQKCLVIAYAAHESGRREVIGLDVGEAETEAFWREFLRGLRARGLTGVRLCVSDCHDGLRAANSGQKSALTGTRCSSRAPFSDTTIMLDARSKPPRRIPSTTWRPRSADQSPIRCPQRHSSVNNARSRADRAASISAATAAGSIRAAIRWGTRRRSSPRRPRRGASRPGIPCPPVMPVDPGGTGFTPPTHGPSPASWSRSTSHANNDASTLTRWLTVAAARPSTTPSTSLRANSAT
jgi:hypothetical protein